MTQIIGLYKLKLPDKIADRLEAGAALHSRYSNITFKILRCDENEILIRTSQGKSFHENYQDKSGLTKLTRELFEPIFTDYVIHVDSRIFNPSPPEIVTDEWIRQQMNKRKIRLKDIANDFGIEKSTLSNIINGNKELSRFSRAAFYYYFKQSKL